MTLSETCCHDFTDATGNVSKAEVYLRALAKHTIWSVGGEFGFLTEDTFDRGLAEVEDDQLLQVLERHEAELLRVRPYVSSKEVKAS